MRAVLTLAHQQELAARIRRRLTRDRADVIAFAAELIAIPSENPPGDHCTQCANVIARWLRELGLEVRAMNPSRRGPCIAGTYGSGGRALYLSGHYDVVPAQQQSQFNPVVRNANLHGRGAADMKAGRKLREQTVPPRSLCEL